MYLYVNKLIHTCNNLEYRQHHKNDNRNVPFLDAYKAHPCLSNEHYKIDIQDDPCEMYYRGLHILHV